MHGREGEEKKRRRHMLPGPALGTAVDDSSVDSFCKDGRKISVGDCALFQAGNSPPFIGIIRSLSTSKDDNYPKLGVNWLYRPADVKLNKGILLEAAPNEVFYSFHKDEIPAASLLHPCKVAFLRKGVELPSGISSFVCRRVYDIANKRLWWLTDQDYINERQEEVDQLLDKTRLEMHAAVQSGGRSPKALSGPTSTQQLKPNSESLQNSSTPFPSQGGKTRKRERSDQGSESVKRERPSKPDDGESGHSRQDSGMIKAELAKITDREGGLVNLEGVEKLVHLMQLDKAEKKIDMAGRVMLADVIAATDRLDCLDRFVQLRGVPVLDDWLQEAHKGKSGDGSSPKETDKSVEELLLTLLRALDKLPVNLNALQTCNVGKSVNHLRSHKNLEIQRKARSLVDTWKKRVEAEMNMNDAKSGPSQTVSWPGKSFADVSHAGNRRSGSSNDVLKNSVMQSSASKAASVKLSHGDTMAKSSLSSPPAAKLNHSLAAVSMGSKGMPDLPLTPIKEERSSSSSQSQNNSQSCSGDHAKTSTWKEDARSSTAGSLSANRSATTGSRSRKSSNGFMGSVISGVQKETGVGKSSSSAKNAQSDKTQLTSERILDLPASDHGSSHRLIVRLPNPGRSPARNTGGGSFEDSSVVGSRASSPGAPDKQEPPDRRVRGKVDNIRATASAEMNTESGQSNDVRDGLVVADETERSSATVTDEDQNRIAEEASKPVEVSRGASSPPASGKGVLAAESKLGKSYEPSFSSMNALIESCAKYSEGPSGPLSVGDDLGMNLLASVAAGEMTKSATTSPVGSPLRNSSVMEGSLTGNNSSSKLRLHQDDAIESPNGADEVVDSDVQKEGNIVGQGKAKDESKASELHPSANCNCSGDGKNRSNVAEHNEPLVQEEEKIPAFNVNFDVKPDENGERYPAGPEVAPSDATSTVMKLEGSDGEGSQLPRDKKKPGSCAENPKGIMDIKPVGITASADDAMAVDGAIQNVGEDIAAGTTLDQPSGDKCDAETARPGLKVEKEIVEEKVSCPSSVIDTAEKKVGCENLIQQKGLPCVTMNCMDAAMNTGEVITTPCSEKLDEDSRSKRTESSDLLSNCKSDLKENSEKVALGENTTDDLVGRTKDDGAEQKSLEPEASLKSEEKSSILACEPEHCGETNRSKFSSADADETVGFVSAAEASPAPASDAANKLDFDLNEGILSDEVTNQGDPATSVIVPGPPSTVHLPSPLPLSVSSMSTTALPAPITITAAKGSFVPPETPLKGKVELGWKGSAATSAFRPAEPRKVLDLPSSSGEGPLSDHSSGKPGRAALDIDLNVPDERVLEDMACRSSTAQPGREIGTANTPASVRNSGGLDLDLNRVDESTDNGHLPVSSGWRFEVPLLPSRSSTSASGGFPNGDVNVLRDFDLNNGPGIEEAGGSEPAQRNQHHPKANVPFVPPLPGLRLNNSEFGNLSSWFPHGNSYSAVTIPSFLPDRGSEQPYPVVASTAGHQRILGPAPGGTFGGDLFRGSVISSSGSMPFASVPPPAFSYGGFPFGNSFPLASTSFSTGSTYMDSSTGGPCFPAVPSQLVGLAGPVQSHFPRPYVISLSDGGTVSGTSESNRKWSRPGLDLNAGPGSTDLEGREERMPLAASVQLAVASSQALAEEQVRMYHVVKRKEPEGGWVPESFSYKQPSWQ